MGGVVELPSDSALSRLLFARDAEGNVAVQRSAPPADDAALARFRELAGARRGLRQRRVDRPPRAPGGLVGRTARARRAVGAAAFDRALDRDWRRTSYSDITAASHEARVASEPEEAVVTDEPEDDDRRPATPPAPRRTPSRRRRRRAPRRVAASAARRRRRGRRRLRPRSPRPSPAAGGALPSTSSPPAAAAHALAARRRRRRSATPRSPRSRRSSRPDRAGPRSARSPTRSSRRPTSPRRTSTPSSRARSPPRSRGGRSTSAIARRSSPACGPRSRRRSGRSSAGCRLRDVARADRLDELTFELPLVGGDEPTGELTPGAIGAVLREHLAPGDPLAGYADRLEDPELRGERARLPDRQHRPRRAGRRGVRDRRLQDELARRARRGADRLASPPGGAHRRDGARALRPAGAALHGGAAPLPALAAARATTPSATSPACCTCSCAG